MPSFHKVERIGRFRIERMLNEGGMAIIFLAIKGHQPVALKMARPVRDKEKQRMLNLAIKKEAEFLARAQHPRIVRVFPMEMSSRKGTRYTYTARAVEFPSRPWYMLLEYLEGDTLDAFVKQVGEPLTVFEAANIAGNIGLGLNYLHNKLGVVHKDLSPKNIVFRTPPMRHRPFDPVIIDFGAVAGAKRPQDVEVGALYIMAPERIQQIQGQLPPEEERLLDKRKTDIWSLGILLYYMLTGRFPFNVRIGRRITSQILTQTPPPIREFNPEVDPALEEFILFRMLAKQPQYRPDIKQVLRFLRPYGSAAVMRA